MKDKILAVVLSILLTPYIITSSGKIANVLNEWFYALLV